MQYKLTGQNDTTNILKSVLNNRGIIDWKTYLSLCDNCADNYENLDNIETAVESFIAHFTSKDRIAILSDTDTDGVCSSVMIYKYIKLLDEGYPVSIIVHQKNKSHGLASNDFTIPDDTKLFIIPDAGSNDIDECKNFIDNNIDVIILDHHVKSDCRINPGILVNNQESGCYNNKEACGAHVTYNFLQALDDKMWNSYCEDYFIDLVALADVADVMSMTSFNTRAMVNYGFQNITNKMFQEIVNAQEFSMKGVISPHTVSFYVSPLINAFLRLASQEERELLIRAFCEDESDTFEYTKRGEDLPTEENIYQHVVRIMKSYKGKQDRARDKVLKTIMTSFDFTNDKVAIIDATGIIDSSITGLVAIKISESIHKPVLLVRDTPNGYSGSGRAFNYCPIDDFRALTEQCPETVLSQGHNSAFGYTTKDIEKSKEWFNKKLANMSFEKVYDVDFVIDSSELEEYMFKDLDNCKNVFAHGVDEPLWYIKNVLISNETANICGKNNDTIQIYDGNTGVKYVMFKCHPDNELLMWINDNWGDESTYINIVGTLEINVYQGNAQRQVSIKDIELTKQN